MTFSGNGPLPSSYYESDFGRFQVNRYKISRDVELPLPYGCKRSRMIHYLGFM